MGDYFCGIPVAVAEEAVITSIRQADTIRANKPDGLSVLIDANEDCLVRNSYLGKSCDNPGIALTSEGGNVDGSNGCGFFHPNDYPFPAMSGRVDRLRDNGGHTLTMLPKFEPGVVSDYNPLIDNPGADAHCQSQDQRGVIRPQDAGNPTEACDTGAVEFAPGDPYWFYFADGFNSGDTSRWSATASTP